MSSYGGVLAYSESPAHPGWIDLDFTWSREAIEDLKHAIRYEFRRYDPDAKRWRVHQMYIDDVLDIFALHGYTCSGQIGGAGAAQNVAPSDPNYALLYIKEDAPEYVIKAVYRAMAHANHPDKNPSPDATKTMQRIQVAYDTIIANLGK